MTRSVVLALGVVLLGSSAGMLEQNQPQTRRVVTTADYDRAVKMLAPSLNGLVVNADVNVNWMPDGRLWYVRTTATTGCLALLRLVLST